MVGEKPEEDDQHADEEGNREKNDVNPSHVARFFPSHEGDQHHGQEEYPKEQRWVDAAGKGSAGFGQNLLGSIYQWQTGVGDLHGVQLVHHLDGGEHILIIAAAVVAALPQGNIYSETPPEEGALGIAIEEVAIAEVGIGGDFGTEGAVTQSALHHIANTGGTVIAEEIVHIVAILRQVVGLKKDEKVVDFLIAEAQVLFPYSASFVGILKEEILEASAADGVVELAAGEGPIEVGNIEIECAIVVDYVDALRRVANADSAMSESGVELVASPAGEHAGKGRVAEMNIDGFLRTEGEHG